MQGTEKPDRELALVREGSVYRSSSPQVVW